MLRLIITNNVGEAQLSALLYVVLELKILLQSAYTIFMGELFGSRVFCQCIGWREPVLMKDMSETAYSTAYI